MKIRFIVGLFIVSTFCAFRSEDSWEQNDRKLKYLVRANGGLLGYFNDGTVTGCPKCDFIKKNVKALYKKEPHETYEEVDGCLIMNNHSDCPQANNEDWIMINYEWQLVSEE